MLEGLAMGSFEWMELDTLTRQIEHSQSRLDAAKATKNLGLVQLLQKEIAGATERRARVLSDITKLLGNNTRSKRHLELVSTQASLSTTSNAELSREERQLDRGAAEDVSIQDGAGVYLPVPADEIIDKEGVAAMWDQLTAADIEHARRAVAKRRSETLSRHAEELRALDAEQTDIDTIEQAINAFVQKFKTGSAEVLPLDAERVHGQAG
jgi:hypothetical protein